MFNVLHTISRKYLLKCRIVRGVEENEKLPVGDPSCFLSPRPGDGGHKPLVKEISSD